MKWIKHSYNINVSLIKIKKTLNYFQFFSPNGVKLQLINSEPGVLADIVESQQELAAGGGKEWTQIKVELNLT